jgi:phycocyanobilin lyase subunit alpha
MEFVDEVEGDGAASEVAMTIEQAIANLCGTDRGDRYYAAWWLGRFRVDSPEAVAALLNALVDESDRTPEGSYPLRRNAARALGKLGNRAVVPALITCLNCDDFYVREAAAQSLGRLADPAATQTLMGLIAGGLAAAQPIPGCPHLAQPFDTTIEALGAIGAIESMPLIEPFLEHPMELVQYAACRAMYQLTGEARYADRLTDALMGDRLQLRRALLTDLGAIGYLPAAEAIAQTLAENSLKLIALRGVLVRQVQGGEERLSEDAVRVMELMDELL